MPATPESTRFEYDELFRFAHDLFAKLGSNEQNAKTAAEVLLASEIRGIESHGVARLHNYEKWLVNGHAPANPEVKIIKETLSTATVTGDGGLGIMVAPQSNQIAIEKAEHAGSAWVSVKDSNHFGIAGYYTLKAIEAKMIGWAMSNATGQVAPVGSVQPVLGTNPFSIGIPAGSYPPIVLDMATSAVAFGKIEIAKRTNATMPYGWALNANGKVTTDPHEIESGKPYAMLPLGSLPETSSHKGYGLCAAVDLLSGVLGDSAFAYFCPHFMLPETSASPPFGKGLGHLFGAMRLDAFTEKSEYDQRVEKWIETIHETEVSKENGFKKVLYPGEPEFLAEKDRRANGIPLLKPVVESLHGISRRNGLQPPKEL